MRKRQPFIKYPDRLKQKAFSLWAVGEKILRCAKNYQKQRKGAKAK